MSKETTPPTSSATTIGDAGLQHAPSAEATSEFLAIRMKNLDFLTRSLAHDVATPLCSASLLVGGLRDSIAELPVAASERDRNLSRLASLHEAVLAIRTRVDFLTDAVGLPAGRDDREFDPVALLRGLRSAFRVVSIERGLEVSTNLPEHALTCRGPFDRLWHALLNLTIAAVETQPAAAALRIGLTVEDSVGEIRISAAGSGSDRETPRLVAEFPADVGTGHGAFAILQQSVAAMGGETLVEVVDTYSGIVVRLPMAHA